MRKKIIFTYLDDNNVPQEELLWAIKVENNLYKIDNIPFFIKNIALNDLISVEREGNNLHFLDLVRPSGYSVIQIIFFNLDVIKVIIEKLVKLGCDFEKIQQSSFFSISIPSNTDYSQVIKLLKDHPKDLDYQEACIG